MIARLGASRGQSDGKGSRKGGASSSGGEICQDINGGNANNPLNGMKKNELLHYKKEGPNNKSVFQFD